ncbi:hypothetical protein TELCIR_23679 [Teladorsagia circumcincta]|uniref:Uncharacterized protein n=1 Tax=Teladorsagia circumcincta TaxID=45464 RepID=A0A2G9TAE6_TELCI|nr:hypothetical protein TELCIR_23679 [Teladorsagia circumcincta]
MRPISQGISIQDVVCLCPAWYQKVLNNF